MWDERSATILENTSSNSTFDLPAPSNAVSSLKGSLNMKLRRGYPPQPSRTLVRGVAMIQLTAPAIHESFSHGTRRDASAAGTPLHHDSGVDRTYISALERGVYSATIDMLGKIATVLDVEPAELLRLQTNSARRKS